ncbi:hypothetical protein [Pseudoneobacillus sp. C159]
MKNSNYFQLDTKNINVLKEEIKNIFWMYHDMIKSYGGFGHNIDFEKVNYERFLLTEIIEESMLTYSHEVDLVKQGSLVALCCKVNDMLEENRRDNNIVNFIKDTLINPKLEKMDFEKEVLSTMLLALEEKPNDEWYSLEQGGRFYQHLNMVYDRFVLNYFKVMFTEGEK